MRTFKIAVLKGDGIGPEVVNAALTVLRAIENSGKVKFEFIEGQVGAVAIDHCGDPLPERTLEICRDSDAILFGAIGDPKYDNSPDLAVRPEQGLLKLRKDLGLFANVRPVQAFDFLMEQSPLKEHLIKGADLVIYRELTGGIYFGQKGYHNENLAYDHCEYSTTEIDRILELAFKAATARKKKLTLVDKANVLETSRLWRKRAAKIAELYPAVALDYLFVDNAAMQLILNPKQFDVIVTENMFGDILSDEASVIAGSIGLLASSSIGEQGALFEPIHGSFPQAKGKNIANPVAAILSAAMMLEYLELPEMAQAIRVAVKDSFEQGVMTPDMSKNTLYGTEDVADFIAEKVRSTECFVLN